MNPVQFIVSGDSHHTDHAGNVDGFLFSESGYRDYPNALTNAKAAADKATEIGVAFLLSTGDDNDAYAPSPNQAPGDGETTEQREARNLVYLAEIWGANGLGAFTGPKYDVMGNWTTGVVSDDSNANGADFITKYLSNMTVRGDVVNSGEGGLYYSFDIGPDLHCIVLNDSYKVLSDTLATWNGSDSSWSLSTGSTIQTTQEAWFKADMAAYRGRPILIFSHVPLSDEAIANESISSYYSLNNASTVLGWIRDEVDAGGDIIAVVNGHHHPGGQAWWEPTPDPVDSTFRSGVFTESVDAWGIRYIVVRCPIVSGGTDSSGLNLDDASDAYSVFTVGDMGEGLPRIRMEGLGSNTAQRDFNNDNYLVA